MSETFAPQHSIGSMGSEFWRIAVPPEIVPELAEKIDWNRFGRRVLVDAAEGIIHWMNPSGPHEDYADAAGKTIEAAARLLGETAKAKLGTRWKRSSDPQNVGLEADASFYIGANAERWYRARRESREAALVFEATTPPGLVVEIEVTNPADRKPELYAALGVPEMWLVDRKYPTRVDEEEIKVEILALQAPSKKRRIVKESLALPGLKATLLPEAFELVVSGRYEELENFLKAALVSPP